MKKILPICALLGFYTVSAQNNIGDLLASGLSDAERFTNAYLAPVTEGAVYNISNGWYNTADAKPLGGFEISIVGNISPFKNKDDKKAFVFRESDYENLQIVGGSDARTDEVLVSSGLGDIEGISVFVEDENGLFREEFELPAGLASEDFNFIPSGYVQASVGLVKGLEVKARFLPKLKFEDSAEIGLFGAGLQYEFTKLLPADKVLPIAISAVIGYTSLNGEYDFTDTEVIEGENQRIDASINTWAFNAVVSTKLPVINFYGGLGYITGKSETDILGTYRVQSGPFQATYEDPFSITNTVSGARANLGFKLKLGFFRLNGEYNIAEFSTATLGINFGFR
ncbi:DUF6588 family protein [Allomuricauda sp. d1]|uniref:DUF6588 family protein n=1 Tax=Allomuricauda sp. d1 TaxID=3136725 RepID=UPI0031D6FAFD